MNNARQITHLLAASLSFARVENAKLQLLSIRTEAHAKRLAGWLRFTEKTNTQLIKCIQDKDLPFAPSKRSFASFEQGLEDGTYPPELGQRGPNNSDEAKLVIPAARLKLIHPKAAKAAKAGKAKPPEAHAAEPGSQPGPDAAVPEPDPDAAIPRGLPEAPAPDADPGRKKKPEKDAGYSISDGTIDSVSAPIPEQVTKLAEAAALLVAATDSAQAELDELHQRENELNRRLTDLQHVSEFYDLDRQQSYRLQRDMRATRAKRRHVKDRIAALEALSAFAQEPSMDRLRRIADMPDGLSKRQYALRQMGDEEVERILNGRKYEKKPGRKSGKKQEKAPLA